MLITCTHCRRDLRPTDEFCPSCGKSAPAARAFPQSPDGRNALNETDELGNALAFDVEPLGPMRTIARFRHAAEAGYFAHELCATARIATQVRIEERRDSVESPWSICFLVEAPESQAADAALALQQLIEQTDGDEDFAVPATPHAPPSYGAGYWIPIVLTLTAGSVAFWGVHKARGPNRVAAPEIGQHRALWQVLESSPEPWVQPLANGRGYRAISIDRVRHMAVLREDLDGDGRVDRESTIRETELVGN